MLTARKCHIQDELSVQFRKKLVVTRGAQNTDATVARAAIVKYGIVLDTDNYHKSASGFVDGCKYWRGGSRTVLRPPK
jgi:hypothetical protein